MNACRRTDIQEIVGGENGILVMLNDNDRVAEIAQMVKRIEQARVVALVQANGRFVKNVEDTGKTGADLRGKPDALAFAP